MSELRISTETVCFAIARARALAAKVAPTGLVEGSNPSDENYQAVLEDRSGDATEEELRRALQALNGEELADLIGLTWLGRDDRPVEDWPDVLREVAEQPPERPIDELLETPLLGEYLEQGLATFGYSCSDIRGGHGAPPH
jgi:hypothetical protein